MDEWVSALTHLLISNSYFCPSEALLSIYLCQCENIQVGCFSTCVFVIVSNSSVVQLEGCYYYCALSLTKDVITDEVSPVLEKERDTNQLRFLPSLSVLFHQQIAD